MTLSVDDAVMLEFVERVARRVVELIEDQRPSGRPRMVDVAELAEILGVSRDTVYRHSKQLGAARIGDGPRPALRFDVERATAAWASRCVEDAPSQDRGSRSRAGTGNKPGRPRRTTGSRSPVELLPIRGQVTA